MTDPAKQALRANQEHYAKPGAFEYISSIYHSRRTQVATELLHAHLAPTSANLVLVDIGPGDSSPVGKESYPQAVRIAIDASAEALEGATGFTTKICADVTAGLPLDSASVDAIFCGELIEHLFDPRRFLDECHRVLVPGGLLLVTTPNIATLQDRLRFLLGKAPRHIDPLHDYIRLHIRPFTPELLDRAFSSVGFRTLDVRSNFVDFHRRGKRYNLPLLARVFPRLGGTIIAIGQKPDD
ncbi:class I SAM-dependent methyltransferase [Humibacillus xanthopallidus]|nr:class I SAM-dependent methyltransferase [Humibacillus xanthopallidus]